MNEDGPRCPTCGTELGFRDDVFVGAGGDHVIGCTRCIEIHNAHEWYGEIKEDKEARAHWRHAG